jgi:cholesterol oxidase
MLDLSPVPDDIYNSRPFGKSRVWDETASGAGYEIQRPNSIFNWDIIRAELKGKSRKSATIGMSSMGNSNGAKFDVTQNYLKQAKESGFVTVYPNQQVININDFASGNFQVDVDKLDPYGEIVDRYSIECEYLFLAAGSIGTSELLVKAKAKGTISGLNDEVGKGWGSNGDLAAVYISGPVPQIRAQAAPCTSLIHDTDGLFPVTFEAWYVPIAPDVGVQGSLGMVSGLPYRGHFEYEAKTDAVDLKWPQEANKVVEEVGRRVNEKLADNSIPRGVTGLWPLGPDVWAGFTAHPLGGAVIAKATDDYGRLKDRLYVMDGALIPASTGSANPALTISALVERNMEHIIAQDF